MKKRFAMKNLDCANCAAKMEAAINKMDEVKSASVSFFTQKLTVEAEGEVTDDLMKKIAKVCRKVEPDCRIIL